MSEQRKGVSTAPFPSSLCHLIDTFKPNADVGIWNPFKGLPQIMSHGLCENQRDQRLPYAEPCREAGYSEEIRIPGRGRGEAVIFKSLKVSENL